MNFKKIAVLLFLFLLLLHPSLCAELKDDDLVFTVFGDSRVAFQGAPIPVAYKRILTEINLINPDLIVHTGDLVFGYGDSEEELKIEYSNVGKLVSTVVPRIYFVPGNHDFQTPLTTKHFIELTGQKRDYFSFDRKAVTFIILNTDVPGQVGEITGEQRKWLANELEKKKSSRAIFVFMHRPLFSFLKPNADDKGDLHIHTDPLQKVCLKGHAFFECAPTVFGGDRRLLSTLLCANKATVPSVKIQTLKQNFIGSTVTAHVENDPGIGLYIPKNIPVPMG